MRKPYSAPHRSQLSFCSEYTCTCCSASHDAAVARSIQSAQDDDTFSKPCLEAIKAFACRICDPEVGVGGRPHVCSGSCESLFDACRDDYFGQQRGSERLVPCPQQEADSMLLCSKLHEIAQDGLDYCALAGVTTVNEGDEKGEGPACWDVTQPQTGQALCDGPQQKRPAPRGAEGVRDGIQLSLRGWATVVAVTVAGAWLLSRSLNASLDRIAAADRAAKEAAARAPKKAAGAAADLRQQQQQKARKRAA